MIAIADEPITNLVIWSKDGAKVAYALTEKPSITFTKTDLVITTNSMEVHYPLDNMFCLTYEKSSEAGIIGLKKNESTFKLRGETLLFPSLKANSTVSVYSANGILIFKQIVQQNGEYAFSISNLNTGVYMVIVNGLSYKIVKR